MSDNVGLPADEQKSADRNNVKIVRIVASGRMRIEPVMSEGALPVAPPIAASTPDNSPSVTPPVHIPPASTEAAQTEEISKAAPEMPSVVANPLLEDALIDLPEMIKGAGNAYSVVPEAVAETPDTTEVETTEIELSEIEAPETTAFTPDQPTVELVSEAEGQTSDTLVSPPVNPSYEPAVFAGVPTDPVATKPAIELPTEPPTEMVQSPVDVAPVDTVAADPVAETAPAAPRPVAMSSIFSRPMPTIVRATEVAPEAAEVPEPPLTPQPSTLPASSRAKDSVTAQVAAPTNAPAESVAKGAVAAAALETAQTAANDAQHKSAMPKMIGFAAALSVVIGVLLIVQAMRGADGPSDESVIANVDPIAPVQQTAPDSTNIADTPVAALQTPDRVQPTFAPQSSLVPVRRVNPGPVFVKPEQIETAEALEITPQIDTGTEDAGIEDVVPLVEQIPELVSGAATASTAPIAEAKVITPPVASPVASLPAALPATTPRSEAPNVDPLPNVALTAPDPVLQEIAPAKAPVSDVDQEELMAKIATGTLAALRGKPSQSPLEAGDTKALFAQVRAAMSNGMSRDEIDAMLNADLRANRLTVPNRLIARNGRVDTDAILAAIRNN